MKKLLPILAIIMIFLVRNTSQADAVTIPDQAIRFRVIANSNSNYDQELKLKIRDKIQNKMYILLNDSKSLEQARQMVEATLPQFESLVQNTLIENKDQTPFTINYGLNYFPEKTYKGITYDEGYYESLVITLGKGEGDNWWCVLFPPLCLLESEETEAKTEVEYKFWIQETLDKYL